MKPPAALFVRDGNLFSPTGIGVSPWNGRSIGGVPLAALSAHLMAALPSSAPMHIARLTLDILGTPPMEPLTGEARVVRDGRRFQLVESELAGGGRVWARATMLRVREEATPAAASGTSRPLPDPATVQTFSGLCETASADEAPPVPGRGARWVNFLPQTVAGAPLAPLERAAMLADFASGISPVLPVAEWTFANLDITLHLVRLPRGAWLLNEATSESAGNGVAVANGRLSDGDGVFGHARQTVFLDRRRAG